MKKVGVISTLTPSILIDAGPLIALVDHDDPNYERAMQALKMLPKAPFLTIWPCFTEAMYLLGRAGGYPAQVQLLNFLQAGAVRLWNPDPIQAPLLESRIIQLMATYRDSPCDFADATVVAVAEILNIRRVFTFDRHFYAYRTTNGDALEVSPP